MPYSILLAYIGAQVIVRFIYRQNKKSEKTYNDINQKSHCSCIKSIFNYIYPWNDKFRFVTISLCTYGTSFIFLYYLICTLTFHAIIGRSNYISILIDIVESMLNIGEFQFCFSNRTISLLLLFFSLRNSTRVVVS